MNPLLLFLAFVPLVFLKLVNSIIWVPQKIQHHFRRQGICGPRYRAFFGNTREIRQLTAEALAGSMPFTHDIVHRVDPRYHVWSAMYGKMFVFWFGTKARLTVTKPEMIKAILLNSSGAFERLDETPITKYLLGDGLFRLRGKKWVQHRKIITPAFNMERVKGWVPAIIDSTTKMLNKWETGSGGSIEFELEVNKELHNFTADVISRVAFGSDYDEGKRIFQLQGEQMVIVSQALRQVYIPGSRFIPTRSNRRLWELEKEIQVLLQKLVWLNMEVKGSPKNLLNLMISATKHHEEDERIEIQEIIEECKAFYFAGKETSANLLTWLLLLLALHQEWQIKAREEVIKIFGSQSTPKADDLNNLKIVSMVLNETLRLYPPVTALTRQTSKKVELDHIEILPGTQFYIPTAAVHRDAEIWGKDAHVFNPLRFLDGKKHMASFFPFGMGARMCVGQNLLMVEAKIALAMILQRFTFLVSPSYVHAPMQFLTLQPQHGAQIIFRRMHHTTRN